MMDWESFLSNICDQRHDDAALLVFSDWLEDQGDRAAFGIRAAVTQGWRPFRTGDGDARTSWATARKRGPEYSWELPRTLFMNLAGSSILGPGNIEWKIYSSQADAWKAFCEAWNAMLQMDDLDNCLDAFLN